MLDLDRSDTHIHNIEAKRCKVNNDSATYLWHCRLGHIGVKRMKKLHTDGILESLDACKPCLMGKMTKTPFSGTMERATDLLEIIHTDVCGPMNIEARSRYHYFLTFTDDLSRYGYIYLMKHKSEIVAQAPLIESMQAGRATMEAKWACFPLSMHRV